MNASLPPDIQHFIYISVCIVSLCIQSVVLLMATEGQTQLELQASTSSNAIWTEPETTALMSYLLAKKVKMGDLMSTLSKQQPNTYSPSIQQVYQRQQKAAKQNLLWCVSFIKSSYFANILHS